MAQAAARQANLAAESLETASSLKEAVSSIAEGLHAHVEAVHRDLMDVVSTALEKGQRPTRHAPSESSSEEPARAYKPRKARARKRGREKFKHANERRYSKQGDALLLLD